MKIIQKHTPPDHKESLWKMLILDFDSTRRFVVLTLNLPGVNRLMRDDEVNEYKRILGV